MNPLERALIWSLYFYTIWLQSVQKTYIKSASKQNSVNCIGSVRACQDCQFVGIHTKETIFQVLGVTLIDYCLLLLPEENFPWVTQSYHDILAFKRWVLQTRRNIQYEYSCLKAFLYSIVSKPFPQGSLACYIKKKKKVAKLVLTHLLRTDKQKFTNAVLNKINSEPFCRFSQIQQHF